MYFQNTGIKDLAAFKRCFVRVLILFELEARDMKQAQSSVKDQMLFGWLSPGLFYRRGWSKGTGAKCATVYRHHSGSASRHQSVAGTLMKLRLSNVPWVNNLYVVPWVLVDKEHLLKKNAGFLPLLLLCPFAEQVTNSFSTFPNLGQVSESGCRRQKSLDQPVHPLS